MQQPALISLPGYRLNDYQLVVLPPEEVRSRILRARKEFSDKYRVSPALGGKPWLALMGFRQVEMMEERIVQRLRTVAMGFYPFKVELDGFGSFPAHSLFIRVSSKTALRNLVREIKPWQRLLKGEADNKPYFMEDPYFLLGRKLQPWQYEEAWKEYRDRHFTGRFIAEAMMLLKRPPNGGAYQLVERFEFRNLPVNTVQGQLF